ncbi:MAG TPA: hypothetical protein VIS77_13975 [Burkholderiales bacterium]
MHAPVVPFAESVTAPRRLAPAAAIALVLTLAVIGASAYIRFVEADGVAPLLVARGLHRICASLAAIAVIVGVVLAWPARDARLRTLALVALALTLVLSAIGIAWGMTPPPAARAGNLLGGLALVAALAALLGRAARASQAPRAARALRLAAALAFSQALLGAWLAAHPEAGPDAALLVHVLLGLSTAAVSLRAAHRLLAANDRHGIALAAAAVLAVLAGAASALFALPPAAALVHPVAVALLVAALALGAVRLR